MEFGGHCVGGPPAAQVAAHVPSIPVVGLVSGTFAPFWNVTDAGCPESQTHPLGHGAPPIVQTLVQNPRFAVPTAQLQAPWVASLTVPTPEQASPIFFVRCTGVVVQEPRSVWQW